MAASLALSPKRGLMMDERSNGQHRQGAQANRAILRQMLSRLNKNHVESESTSRANPLLQMAYTHHVPFLKVAQDKGLFLTKGSFHRAGLRTGGNEAIADI